MDFLEQIPAMVRMALALTFVLILLRVKLPLGLGLIGGGLALKFLFPVAWGVWFKALIEGVLSIESLFLTVLVLGTLILSTAMNESGQIERVVGHFRALVGESRITLVAFPAMIGLIPMPGGAVFSAPMVDAASRRSDLSSSRKTVVNYWFRHIWEYWFPLYPGVILAIALTGAPPAAFVLMGLPMTLVSVAVGYAILLHSVRLDGERRINVSREHLFGFVGGMTPVILMVLSLLVLGPILGRLVGGSAKASLLVKRAPILVGLVLSIGSVLLANRMPATTVPRILAKRSIWEMVLLIVGLVVFKEAMDASGAVAATKANLQAYRIPLVLLVALLPFVTGVVIGIAMGFVGVSFPVVLSLLASSGVTGADALPYIFLAYACGYAGMMLSPVHLCLLLTSEYFHSRLARAYAYLIPMATLVVAAAFGLFWLYRG